MSTPSASTPWEPPSPEELHEMLPQYEISEILGCGGMGAVYKGRQVKLNRFVAIKLLPETLVDGEDELNFVARFELEAQAMANLDHPGIVSVYDFGETKAGQCYFVMEFIDGMDIHQYLQANGGRLSQEHALAITSHVLDALEYAHSQGIVHRDIKPANVLLNQQGRVKIADFGLAKRFVEDEDGESGPALTMTNVAVGTPDYVAPEALEEGRTPDHRADLYAVGVMLYQMLTGTLPRGQFKTPSEHHPELDLRLDDIVSQAMQADPDDRYSSATEIRGALDAVLSQPALKVVAADEVEPDDIPQAVPSVTVRGNDGSKSPSKTGLWVGVAAAVIAIVVGAVVISNRGDKDGDTAANVSEENKPEVAEDNAVPAEPPAPDPVPSEAKPTAVATADPPGRQGQKSNANPPEPTPDPKPATPDTTAAPPKPDPTIAANPPTPAKPEPGPETKEPEKEEKLSPELTGLLNKYLDARQRQIEGLAGNYQRGLNARQETAADEGDLKLVKAYRGESSAVAALKKTLAAGEGDLTERVRSTATLPDLPNGSPEGLVTLRKTWTAERAKIRKALEDQLATSLKNLEKRLTRERQIEKAEAVLAFRETLTAPEAPSATVATAEKKTAPAAPKDPDSTAAAAAENPFGWKPIPVDPFPLARPQRQPTPCRLVAWRIDGDPVDEKKFREKFGGVPADLGEIVDFDASPSTNDEANAGPVTYPLLAIRADGTIARLQWRGEDWEAYEPSLRDVVAISVGRFASIALRGDGTVVAMIWHPGAFGKEGINLDAAAQWKDVVQVCGGDLQVAGLTAGGTPLFAGANRHKQGEAPADLQTQILAVDVKNASGLSVLMQRLDDGYRVERFGKHQHSLQLSAEDRWFRGLPSYSADRQGRLNGDLIGTNMPNKVKSIRGAGPRDVIRVEFAQNFAALNDVGLSAAGSANGEWEFWGDVSAIGEFDDKYCNQKAKGAWKLAIMYPYAVALKPVAKLTPEDWTGGSVARLTSTTPSATTPKPPDPAAAADPSVNPFGWKPIPDDPFPLSMPQRQTTPCRMIAWRIDGDPVDEAHFRKKFGGVPAEMGDIVDLDARGEVKPDVWMMATAIRSDGTVVSLMKNDPVREAGDQLHDVVQISVSNTILAALRSDGTVVAVPRSLDVLAAKGTQFDQVNEWKNIVQVNAGPHMVGAITANGEPRLDGTLHEDQRNLPETWRNGIIDLDVGNLNQNALLAKVSESGTQFRSFGRYANEFSIEEEQRFFLDPVPFYTDTSGRLKDDRMQSRFLHSIKNLRSKPRDVVWLSSADGDYETNDGISFAQTGSGEWTIWGSVGDLGDFDDKYCEERAAGSWKVFAAYPYLLALKPKAKLTPEDWMGPEPTTSAKPPPVPSTPAPTPKPPAPAAAADPSVNPFGWKPLPDDPFPLARPQRQPTPCRLVAWRADGEPVDADDFREKFGGVPADLGEIVDFDGYPSINEKEKLRPGIFSIMAIRADGSAAALRWVDEEKQKKSELRNVVQLSVGWQVTVALLDDGSVVTMRRNLAGWQSKGLDLEAAQKWRNVVRVASGHHQVAAVTADGRPLFAGDNTHGQGSPPADLQSRIVDVDQTMMWSMSALVQQTDDGYRWERFGRLADSHKWQAGERWFLGMDSYGTDRLGRLQWCSAKEQRANSVASISGAGPRGVIRVETSMNYDPGVDNVAIAAACSKNDEWEFWGATDDGIGGFDARYCDEKAKGAWKLRIMYPYVVALKPAAKVIPEDWTGTATPSAGATTRPPSDSPGSKTPGKLLRVTVDGAGDTYTLDQALAAAKPGDTVSLEESHLNSGEQPAVISTPEITLKGNRNRLAFELQIGANKVTIDSLDASVFRIEKTPEDQPVRNLRLVNCRARTLSLKLETEVHLENCCLTIGGGYKTRLTARHCNFIPTNHTNDIVSRSTYEFENCILSGEGVVFRCGVPGPDKVILRNCLLYSGDDSRFRWYEVVAMSGFDASGEQFKDRPLSELGDVGFEVADCKLGVDPRFVNPDVFIHLHDFNLEPGSPARGAASDGKDLGAIPDLDGWPLRARK